VEELLQICDRLFSPGGESERRPREAERSLYRDREDSFRAVALNDAARGAERGARKEVLAERPPREAERSLCRDREDSLRAVAFNDAARGAERGALVNT
jgi:hypothetical protein